MQKVRARQKNLKFCWSTLAKVWRIQNG